MTVLPRRGAAVLGAPIAHSLSPALHKAAYDVLGLSEWDYDAIECAESDLLVTLHRLDDDGLAGVSLTMPLKRAVLPMLAREDRLVRDVGAANTVLFGGVAGEWWGANTDVAGMVAALRRAGVTTPPRRVCVLGGGATSASTLAALRELGVVSAAVVVRRPESTTDLAAAADRLQVSMDLLPWADAGGVLSASDLVVSTTPAGATDSLAPHLSPRKDSLLFDVVYSPWPTALATVWRDAGGRVVGGLELLVEQAAVQVKLMTGKDAPVDAMRSAGQAALGVSD